MSTRKSLALLLSYENATDFFAGLRCVVLDELHALAESKRGALFSLAVARLRALAPQARFVGLSATVADPPALADFLKLREEPVEIVLGEPGAPPVVSITRAASRAQRK